MPIHQRHIDELKAIYKNEFGHHINDKEAWEMAQRLVNLFRLLIQDGHRPRTDSQTEKYDKPNQSNIGGGDIRPQID